MAAAARPHGSPTRRSGSRRLRAAARGAGARRAAGPPVGVRPHAPARRAALQVLRGARRPPRRAPVPAAPLARAVGRGSARAPPPVVRRAEDPPRRAAREPAARLLGPGRARAAARHRPARATPTTTTRRRPAATLLARIQADVRADRPAARPAASWRRDDERLEPDDRSVQVHACHGRARQVEVLRDAILHLLAEDPTLEPRDVIVMCPGHRGVRAADPRDLRRRRVSPEDDELDDLPGAEPPLDLRVRLADRSLRQTNPVLGVRRRLLELADQRLTASQVLDLADREPVRRRFGLDDDDVARVEEWAPQSGIRWGLDAAHRAPFKLDKLAAGTWRAGSTACCSASRWPTRSSGCSAASFRSTTSRAATSTSRAASPSSSTACRRPSTRSPADAGRRLDRRDRRRGRRADRHPPAARPGSARSYSGCSTTSTREAAVGARARTTLALAEVRALLADRLEGRPTRTNFRTGHLTICTLVPMRSVPHRVVCLLGLDDGEFPRKSVRDGDDLVLHDPHVGDRDARTEDRQMLLDALMAATDRLIVTYTGKDERTNTPRPPAVPVGELLDVIDAHARAADGARARDRVLVQHPLQPFDPRNFTLGELVPGAPLGLRPRDAAGRPRARRAAHRRPPPFLRGPLPETRTPAGRARRPRPLRRASDQGVPAPAARRLGSATTRTRSTTRWRRARPTSSGRASAIGSSRAARRARTSTPASRPEVARGLLPPERLGDPVVEDVRPTVDALATSADRSTGTRPRSVDVKVELPRRPHPQRHGPGRPRRPAARGDVLAGAGQAPDRDVGALARAQRRLPRPADRAPC